MLDFLLGAAIIALPQHQVPLAIGTALYKTVGHIKQSRRKAQQKRIKITNSTTSVTDELTLTWDALSCTLTTKTGERKLLDNLSGQARPGRLLAIMGPSGSGKTTVLNALAGQIGANPKLTLCGEVLINGVAQQESTHRQGYVQQEDLFFSMLSVRETLSLAAQLQVENSGAKPVDEYVTDMMSTFGLTKSSGTIVGDSKKRGLSGGEKKRLSIACELVNRPHLVFADEPTTGLDSFQAEKVMKTLKDLALAGNTVVCSIHQPRSSIFALFDDILLLSEGVEVYSGPADAALPYFEQLGHTCPEHYNPAEFLADLISVDTSSPDAEAESRERVSRLIATYQGQHKKQPHKHHGFAPLPDPHPRHSWIRQFTLLFGRSWRQVSRDKLNAIARAMSNVSSALVFGAIFWNMGRSQSSIQDRMGLLQVCAVGTAMNSMIKTLNVFPTERTIVSRERSKGAYEVLPYITAKLCAEVPVGALFPALFGCLVYPTTGLHRSFTRFLKFLGITTLEAYVAQAMGLAVGAFAPSTEAALAMGPAIMLIFIVFGGYYVNPDNVPLVFKWIPKASLIKTAFEGFCVNEFTGLEFEGADQPGNIAKGEQVLARLGFEKSSIRKVLAHEARLLAFNYWVTYCILKAKKPKFQPLLDPEDAKDVNGTVANGKDGTGTQESAQVALETDGA